MRWGEVRWGDMRWGEMILHLSFKLFSTTTVLLRRQYKWLNLMWGEVRWGEVRWGEVFFKKEKEKGEERRGEMRQWMFGKIQGDGRKFLDRFKSYFGSQISSQSLNEAHIYRLQPKSATIGDFFPFIFVFDCFESASRIANGERSRRSAARRPR